MNQQRAFHTNYMEMLRAEFVARIVQVLDRDGSTQVLPGLTLNRYATPPDPVHGVARPSLCVIAQGAKEVLLGDQVLHYDPGHYLVAAAELPVVGHVTQASVDQPYLSIRLDLDAKLVGSILVERGRLDPAPGPQSMAIGVSTLDDGLLDSVVRLLRITDTPTDAEFLVPHVTREIVYRLLAGEQSNRVRHIATQAGAAHRVMGAIDKLRREFAKPLAIDAMATEVNMSVSSFHHHFKTVTAMSPLQFQKQLRLQEARRLMLTADFDAGSAGAQVGYEDAAHFNREYKRLFGEPPKRDAARLREAILVPADM